MRSPRLLLPIGSVVLLAAATLFGADQSASAMAGAATKFLAGLTPGQRQVAQFALPSDEFTRWHFIPPGPPPGFPRNGLTIKDMQPAQRQLAHELLKTGLSQRGYLTASQIIELETTLGAMEAAARAPGARVQFGRDPESYYVAVFGTPSADGTWGWRFEGHHISLHFTVAQGAITVSTPTFFGTNPAEVRDGDKKGLRILGAAEDTARALLESLDATQRAKAVLPGDAPGDILTMNRFPVDPLAPAGLPASEMTDRQRTLLMAVVDVYSSQLTPDVAALRMTKMRQAGMEKLAFVWAGPATRGQKHYYRVQGPTFLIEYDNTQNDGNHVHSVWRDFAGDFGRDLLREHLGAAH